MFPKGEKEKKGKEKKYQANQTKPMTEKVDQRKNKTKEFAQKLQSSVCFSCFYILFF